MVGDKIMLQHIKFIPMGKSKLRHLNSRICNRVVRCIVVFLMPILLCHLSVADGGQAETNLELINRILETYKYTESLINNISMEVEFRDRIAPGLISEEQTKEIRRIEASRYVYDNDGRIRLESELSYPDSSGEFKSSGHIITRTFDNEKGMVSDEGPTLRSVSIDNVDHASAIRRPSGYCTAFSVPISELIANALSTKDPILVETEESDQKKTYVLSVPRKVKDREYLYKLWLDPQKMYYATRIERYYDGKLVGTSSSVPQKLQDDIWFPLQGRREYFNYENGERKVLQETDMKVKEVKVNIEDLPRSLFEIELLQGTLVADARYGETIEYFVGLGPEADKIIEEITENILKDNFVDSEKISAKHNEAIKSSNLDIHDNNSPNTPALTDHSKPGTSRTDDISAKKGLHSKGRDRNSIFWGIGIFSVIVLVLFSLRGLFFRHKTEAKTI